ncbi:hypothetical protein [Longimicrobium sp.]|uniref:hypothetical protein n=1 Tax=Longimicrobium sp. TaxID=2029185 RepID=UPI002E32FF23|nr:hypothetical protein [Longimicrobium sp.]HEX6036918.1 hypothetical protein [Longimicrobium sp.]
MTTEQDYEGSSVGLKLRDQLLHLSPITGMVLFGLAGVLWLVTTQPLSVVGSSFELDTPLPVDRWAVLFSSVFGLITLLSGLFAMTVYVHALTADGRPERGDAETEMLIESVIGNSMAPVLEEASHSAACEMVNISPAYRTYLAFGSDLPKALLAEPLMIAGAHRSLFSAAQLLGAPISWPLRHVETMLNMQRSMAKLLAIAKPVPLLDNVHSSLNVGDLVFHSRQYTPRFMYSGALLGASISGSLPGLPFDPSPFGRLLSEVALATKNVQLAEQRVAIRASLLRLIAGVLDVDDAREERTLSVEAERARTMLDHLDPTLGPEEMDALQRLFDPEYLIAVLKP